MSKILRAALRGRAFSLMILAACMLLCCPGAYAEEIDGTYVLVQDSDGTKPKKAAVVTITFTGGRTGTVSMRAEQPGQTITDSGRYSISGNRITISFRDGVWEARNQLFSLANGTLTLPFMAVSASEGTGTSTWSRQDSSGGGGGGGGKKPDPANQQQEQNRVNDTLPPGFTEIPVAQKKESCVDCAYGRCIRELIAQKKAFIGMYRQIGQSFADQYRAADNDGRLRPAETVDKTGFMPALPQYNANTRTWMETVQRQSEEIMAKYPVPACRMSSAMEIQISTDQTDCTIDNAQLGNFAAAVPCREISEIANRHEALHLEKCQDRKKRFLLPTPYGLSMEEMKTHQMEVDSLTRLLADIEKTPNGCWRCGKTQVVYMDKVECNVNCPDVRLSGNVMFKCFRLNKEGKHVMLPGNQF